MRLAALVLAAGRSRRYGADNKLLAMLDGEVIVRRTVASVCSAGFDDIVVVTGPDSDAIESVLHDFPVRCVRCAEDLDGMGYSIAAGACVLDGTLDGVAIVPGDMPLLSASTLRMLVSVFGAQGGQRIVYGADMNGTQRNPVIWPGSMIAQLSALQGSEGAKSLIRIGVAVRLPDRELLDIDNQSELAHAHRLLSRNSVDG